MLSGGRFHPTPQDGGLSLQLRELHVFPTARAIRVEAATTLGHDEEVMVGGIVRADLFDDDGAVWKCRRCRSGKGVHELGARSADVHSGIGSAFEAVGRPRPKTSELRVECNEALWAVDRLSRSGHGCIAAARSERRKAHNQDRAGGPHARDASLLKMEVNCIFKKGRRIWLKSS